MRRFQYFSVEKDRPDLLEEWFLMRAQLYAKAGFVDSSEFDGNGFYRDDFDSHAEHFLVRDQNRERTAGIFRLVHGGLGALPVEASFGIGGGPKTRELSSFALLPEYRKSYATFGSYWLVYQRSLTEKFSDVYAMVEKPLLRNLKQVGLPVRVLGDAKYLYNTSNYPVVIRPKETVQALRAADHQRGGTTCFAKQMGKKWSGTLDAADLFVTPTTSTHHEG